MKNVLKFICLALLLLGMPLTGLLLHGLDPRPYLEFPPRTDLVPHAPFSRDMFIGLSLFLALALAPFVWQGVKKKIRKKSPSLYLPFPWWGWVGLFLLILSWIVAWTRFSWFTPLQPHTFTPLWLAYILIVNALTFKRRGTCLLLDRPFPFLLLFPLSALFWWFFEFLNRFVQNWYYVGAEFGPREYFLYATLPFSTVLPAVISTRDWLLSFDWPENKFNHFLVCRFPRPNFLALTVLVLSSGGLFFIGLYPDYLFPLVWISPLLIFVSLQELLNESHLFLDLSRGNWTLILTSALAALMCGFFWEMWNYYSLAQWRYAIPFVDCCKIFEMPLLGYAGYLPFGLECSIMADLILERRSEVSL